jgi:hypothetical protein
MPDTEILTAERAQAYEDKLAVFNTDDYQREHQANWAACLQALGLPATPIQRLTPPSSPELRPARGRSGSASPTPPPTSRPVSRRSSRRGSNPPPDSEDEESDDEPVVISFTHAYVPDFADDGHRYLESLGETLTPLARMLLLSATTIMTWIRR